MGELSMDQLFKYMKKLQAQTHTLRKQVQEAIMAVHLKEQNATSSRNTTHVRKSDVMFKLQRLSEPHNLNQDRSLGIFGNFAVLLAVACIAALASSVAFGTRRVARLTASLTARILANSEDSHRLLADTR